MGIDTHSGPDGVSRRTFLVTLATAAAGTGYAARDLLKSDPQQAVNAQPVTPAVQPKEEKPVEKKNALDEKNRTYTCEHVALAPIETGVVTNMGEFNNGAVTEFMVKEGDTVETGTVVVKCSYTNGRNKGGEGAVIAAKNSLESAKATEELNVKKWAITQALAGKSSGGTTSQEDLVRSRTGAEGSTAQRKAAEGTLQNVTEASTAWDMEYRGPKGKVREVLGERGMAVGVGAIEKVMIRIDRTDYMIAPAQIPEKLFREIDFTEATVVSNATGETFIVKAKPSKEELQKGIRTGMLIPTQKVTPEGNRLLNVRFENGKGENELLVNSQVTVIVKLKPKKEEKK